MGSNPTPAVLPGRYTIRVERLDQELLVLDGLGLAQAFFAGETSAAGEVALGGLGNPGRIEADDILELNRSMRARSPHKAWADVVAAETPWLGALPPDLDLLEADDERWQAAGGDELVAAALAATIGPGRGMSVATKLLHLKRPRLFPMLDGLVAELLGAGPAVGPSAQLATALTLMRLVRSEGRRNLEPLQAVRKALAADGRGRSLVRVLDAILWSAHPAAGLSGGRRRIEVGLR